MPLTSPAAADSGQPQLSVSDRGVLLSWIERSGTRATLKFAERRGQSWSAPRTVASGTNWFVNWADVPSVIRLGSGTLAAHWLQKSGDGTYAYDVRLAFSRDDGKTWSASVTPHHDGTKTEHGFASLFQMPDAGLGLVWLDGRAMKAADAHGGQGSGEMSVRFASFSEDGQQRSELPVDLRVCECCPTTAAVTPDGVITAFRDRSKDEVRDIYVSRLDKGKWTAPSAVHNDGWRIPPVIRGGRTWRSRAMPAVPFQNRFAWMTTHRSGGSMWSGWRMGPPWPPGSRPRPTAPSSGSAG
ncbi:MAG: glycoside hydrolase [Acidobacteria bacterium]|nr:glycoside hydrolase [Acidobacteriota bacterium]